MAPFLAVILIPGVFAKSPESLRGVSIPKFLASVAASSTCVSGRAGPRIATFRRVPLGPTSASLSSAT